MAKKIIICWIFPLLIALAFFLVIYKPGIFNMLAYSLYMMVSQDKMNETGFVRVSEVVATLILFFGCRFLFKRFLYRQ